MKIDNLMPIDYELLTKANIVPIGFTQFLAIKLET